MEEAVLVEEVNTLAKIASWFCDQGNITFLIAVAGFAMSVFTAIRNSVKSKEAYTIEVIDYAFRNTNVIQFLVCVSNLSGAPLSITEISTFGTVCELYPKMIYGKPENWNFRHTAEFPLCISAHGCQYAFLEFLDGNFQSDQLAPGKTVHFEIRSTQKRAQKTVILEPQSHYLHTRSLNQYNRIQY